VRDRRAPCRGASDGAATRLAVDLGTSLARTRTAWDAATLRGDAALQAGDRAAAVRALDEQRALLRALHAQVDTAIGRAAVAREAEAMVGGVAPVAEPLRDRGQAGWRRGAAAIVGTVAMALVGLLGVSLEAGPSVPDVAPLAEPRAEDVVGASEGIQPVGVAFERVTDVLVELGAALARAALAPRPGDEAATAPPRPSGAPTPADGPASDHATRSAADEPAAGDGATEDRGLEQLDDLAEPPDDGPGTVEDDPEGNPDGASLPDVGARLDGPTDAERVVGDLGDLGALDVLAEGFGLP
jgi:hypothetical protein